MNYLVYAVALLLLASVAIFVKAALFDKRPQKTGLILALLAIPLYLVYYNDRWPKQWGTCGCATRSSRLVADQQRGQPRLRLRHHAGLAGRARPAGPPDRVPAGRGPAPAAAGARPDRELLRAGGRHDAHRRHRGVDVRPGLDRRDRGRGRVRPGLPRRAGPARARSSRSSPRCRSCSWSGSSARSFTVATWITRISSWVSSLSGRLVSRAWIEQIRQDTATQESIFVRGAGRPGPRRSTRRTCATATASAGCSMKHGVEVGPEPEPYDALDLRPAAAQRAEAAARADRPGRPRSRADRGADRRRGAAQPTPSRPTSSGAQPGRTSAQRGPGRPRAAPVLRLRPGSARRPGARAWAAWPPPCRRRRRSPRSVRRPGWRRRAAACSSRTVQCRPDGWRRRGSGAATRRPHPGSART